MAIESTESASTEAAAPSTSGSRDSPDGSPCVTKGDVCRAIQDLKSLDGSTPHQIRNYLASSLNNNCDDRQTKAMVDRTMKRALTRAVRHGKISKTLHGAGTHYRVASSGGGGSKRMRRRPKRYCSRYVRKDCRRRFFCRRRKKYICSRFHHKCCQRRKRKSAAKPRRKRRSCKPKRKRKSGKCGRRAKKKPKKKPKKAPQKPTKNVLREVSGRSTDMRSEAPGSMGAPKPGQNILSLLSNAQNKYEQGRGTGPEQHGDTRPIEHPSGDASGMSQISLNDLFRIVNQHKAKAGLSDSATETGQAKNPMFGRSLSVTEVEAQVQDSAAPPTASQGQDSRHPILRMISTKTVEELERQHLEEHKRSKAIGGHSLPTEGKSVPVAARSSKSPGGATEGASMNLMQLLSQGDSSRSFVPVSLPSSTTSVSDLEQNLTSLSLPAMPKAPMAEQIHEEDSGCSRTESISGGSAIHELPTLLKPSDLDPSLAKPKLPLASGTRGSPAMASLLTPQAFSDGASHDSATAPASSTMTSSSSAAAAAAMVIPKAQSSASLLPDVAPLTREQLQQAVLHLIKNDNNFVTTLHAAYLDSFHAATGNKG